MSRFRQTLIHALAAVPAGREIARIWPPAVVPELLKLIWEGYEQLRTTHLAAIDFHEADLQLERSFTVLLHDEIQRIIGARGGYASYVLCHERWEFETIDPASNRPPQYDLAFVWLANPLVLWPCEAKVMRTDASVAAYVADVNGAFLPCIYAPFSSSGAMLAILCGGRADRALINLAAALGVAFSKCAGFEQRSHCVSQHVRAVPAGKSYPSDFTCNHIVFHIAWDGAAH